MKTFIKKLKEPFIGGSTIGLLSMVGAFTAALANCPILSVILFMVMILSMGWIILSVFQYF